MVAPSKKDRVEKPPKQPFLTPERKKLFYKIGGGFVFILIVIVGLTPATGSTQYGICKVFVELSESYPGEMKPLSVDDYVRLGGPVKISYKRIDAFGVESVNTIECSFKKDDAGNMLYELESVDINGKARTYNAENQNYIKKFNTGVASLLANPPDLTLPMFSLDNLAEYKDNE